MDRTMYGKIQPSDWSHPYQCTIKNGTLPGCERHRTLEKPKPVPVYIAEDHHRVVEFIHDTITKKTLPISDNTFVHLDSHPDLLIPKEMPADDAYDKHKLYESHDIENWIIPNCFNGIIRRVVWVKPPWANQIRNKSQKMFVGKCKESGTIRVECKENYFIAEGLYKPKEQLEDVKEVVLDCLTLGNQIVEGGSDDTKEIQSLAKVNEKDGYILDVDLDFFSTQNPFLHLYDKADLYPRLKELCAFTPPEGDNHVQILEAQEKRVTHMKKVEKLFRHIFDTDKLPEFDGADPDPLHAKVASLAKTLSENYPDEEIEWDLIFQAASTVDDGELPHHVSTNEEIEILLLSFGNFLDALGGPPRIVTISRSSSDDYTPTEQVDDIQERVLRLLSSKFECSSPILGYLEDKSEDEEGSKSGDSDSLKDGWSNEGEETDGYDIVWLEEK